MMKRRSFIHKVALAGTAPALLPKSSFAHQTTVTTIKNDPIPFVLGILKKQTQPQEKH